jgi:hypothetical protein
MSPSSLNVTSDDLWGARCGLLHTFTPSSDKSRAGIARQLKYIRGDKDFVSFAQKQIDPNCSIQVVVDVDSLVEAFHKGIMAFVQELMKNQQKRVLVFEHSKKLFVHISYPNPK